MKQTETKNVHNVCTWNFSIWKEQTFQPDEAAIFMLTYLACILVIVLLQFTLLKTTEVILISNMTMSLYMSSVISSISADLSIEEGLVCWIKMASFKMTMIQDDDDSRWRWLLWLNMRDSQRWYSMWQMIICDVSIQKLSLSTWWRIRNSQHTAIVRCRSRQRTSASLIIVTTKLFTGPWTSWDATEWKGRCSPSRLDGEWVFNSGSAILDIQWRI